ncbi:MAG: TolB family protein [Promethearchaeota archaeon]
MKKNYKNKLYIILFSITLLGITTIFTFTSFSSSTVTDIYKTSDKNFRELPFMSQKIAWNENGSQVCVKPLDQENHQICSDGAGGVIITWQDNINYLTTGEDIYVQHIDSNGILRWEVNGTGICTANYGQWNPQICNDGAGGAIITWQDERNGATYDIYAQRIDSNGSVQWNANGTVICNKIDNQNNPQICSDGAGGAIITWEDNRHGTNTDIYAQRIDASGTSLWTLNGTAICTENHNQNFPQIYKDGAEGAIIAWEDDRNGDEGIYVQCIDSDGAVQWEGNGIAVCKENRYQHYIELCNDGAGGAIIAWEDEREGSTNRDIYAQRIDSGGTTSWDVNGTAICTAIENQGAPQIYSVGTDGAIIVWTDSRTGSNNDIYAQHINLNGTITWVHDGKAICTADYGQGNPQICSDGADGAIITWQDYRSGSKNDIYAQRVDLNGDFKWVVNGLPICVADETKYSPQIITDGAGTVIIVWEDYRNGDEDIYAQKIENPPPTSNHPLEIITSMGGSETINWTLIDDFGSGNYRVLANDTNGDYYTWVDWSSWSNNTALNIPINRTNPGYFNYTIEFYDDQYNFGISDTVIVQILEPERGIPGYSLIILLLSSFGIILILSKKNKQFKKLQN